MKDGAGKIKGQCSKQVWDEWYRHACPNAAKMEHEGKLYCGIHDPVRAKARDDAKSAQRQLERDGRDLDYKRREALRVAEDAALSAARMALAERQLESAPGLVAALRELERATAARWGR